MLGKAPRYLELHTVLFSSAISTNHRLHHKGQGRSGSAILPACSGELKYLTCETVRFVNTINYVAIKSASAKGEVC
jgi:hypothetical protein